MPNTHGDLPLGVRVDDRPRCAQSSYSWAGGGTVLTISTVIPEQDLAFELVSSYVGHPLTPMIVTHLMLGPVGRPAEILSVEHAPDRGNPVEAPRDCAYDHAHQLIEVLAAAGHCVSVQLDEHTFAELEQVE